MYKLLSLLATLPFVAAMAETPAGVSITVEPAAAVLATGQSGTATIHNLPAGRTFTLSLRENGGAERERRVLHPAAGEVAVSVSLPTAFSKATSGTLLGIINDTTDVGKPAEIGRFGFVVAPREIKPSAPRPADFDEFWNANLAALASVPPDLVITPGPGRFSASAIPGDVTYAQFTIRLNDHQLLHGQVARPADAARRKLPAIVVYESAGVKPLKPQTVTDLAKTGWLAVNVIAHPDLEIDLPDADYAALLDGKAGHRDLRSYGAQHNDDREKSYAAGLFLGARRALDFVRRQPDWDGKTLVTRGNSQGGALSLIAAALDESVTAVLACVPAYCDLNGARAGRGYCHPYWFSAENLKGKDLARVTATAPYFDLAHLAPRIKAPVLVATGLIDSSCPPSGVAAMTNCLPASLPAEVIFMPQTDHFGHGAVNLFNDRARAWLDELRVGRPAPVQPR